MDTESRIEIDGINAKLYGLAEIISTLQHLARQHDERLNDLQAAVERHLQQS